MTRRPIPKIDELSLRFQQARVRARLTPAEAADLVRVHKRTLQAWERGEQPVNYAALCLMEATADQAGTTA